MKARQLHGSPHTADFEEGDYHISFIEDEVGKAHMTYRPPGVEHCFGAWLTTDPEMADKRGTSGTYWLWNGEASCPTLKPSLGVPAIPPYKWHGFLTNGVFEAC